MLSHVYSDKPVFHCAICSYDLCYSCTHTNTINWLTIYNKRFENYDNQKNFFY